MGNLNKNNIDFARQTLLQRMSRPLPVIALYPKNTGSTRLLIQVISNATAIAIRYIGSTTVNSSITFVGKTTEEVVQEINQLPIPIEAYTIHNTEVLAQGDIISTGADYVEIPGGFNAYDRSDNSGVFLRAKKVAVRHKTISKIKLLDPYLEDPSLPWYPRISNGSFTQKYNGKVYHFYVSEFDNQSWSLTYGKPFKELRGITPTLIKPNVYQLPRYPVFWNSTNITVFNGDAPVSSSCIQDIDTANGILYTNPEFFLSDRFTVSYTYLENSYVYKGINVNGHFRQNPSILDKYVVIYLLPADGYYGSRKQTVYHTIGDSIDDAIGSITVDNPDVPLAIIGAYNVQQLFSSDSVSILDTRVKGGGLVHPSLLKSPVHDFDYVEESNQPPIEDSYEEAYRFFDIGNYDGEAYPGAAAVAVDLPIELTDVMSLSDIKSKYSKFMAAGVYPSIRYTERDLPGITGLSTQVSCAYNLDFSEELTKSSSSLDLSDTIPSTYKGAGWLLQKYDHPTSILSGDWSSFSGGPVISSGTYSYLTVMPGTGVFMPYIKSSSWAGITWEERDVIFNDGSTYDPISYTPWDKKTLYDYRDVDEGHLVKSYLSFDKLSKTKEYRNVVIHSPYLTGDLVGKLESGISDILDVIISAQAGNGATVNGTEIINYYSDISQSSTAYSDYVLSPVLYKHFFNLKNTRLEDSYRSGLYSICEDLLTNGIEPSGHYCKIFLNTLEDYYSVSSGQDPIVISYLESLPILSKAISFANRNSLWNSICDTGHQVATGLVGKLDGSTGTHGPWVGGIPINFGYFPDDATFSGIYFDTPESLGGTYSEVDPNFNPSYLYSYGLPMVMSSAIANSGQLISDANLSKAWSGAYQTAKDYIIGKIETGLYNTRTLSGLDTTTHWFVGHDRLGLYFGNTIFNLIKSYEYIAEYNSDRTSSDVSTPSGISQQNMTEMFTDIEAVLDTAYDVLYHNILRGGITDSYTPLSIYGYGWYLNNWTENYGIASKTYSGDYRGKFEKLFDLGLKQLVKNTVTPEGQLLETTAVYGEVGPYASNLATNILYPIAEGLKYDYSGWAGVAEGIVTTLINTYGRTGLYYLDPFKNSLANGKENDVLGGLVDIYKAVATTGEHDRWEPIKYDLNSVRGTIFLPSMPTHDANPPVAGWSENVNSLAFWKYYNSGDVSQAVETLKSIGINTLSVPIDYMYWRKESGSLYDKLDHLLEVSNANNIRVIPSLFKTDGTAISSANISGYVYDYGHTGNYTYASLSDNQFMTGSHSGKAYVSGLVTRYDNDPAILAWELNNKTLATTGFMLNINSMANTVKLLTDTPVIYNSDQVISRYENGTLVLPISSVPIFIDVDLDPYSDSPILENPNIDIIGISPNNLFNSFIDTVVDNITKPVILNRYGDGGFGDYGLMLTRADNRGIPIIMSNLFVQTGSLIGNIYSDYTTRSKRQLDELANIAIATGVSITGSLTEERTFTDKFYYPAGYTAGYSGMSIINDLSSWNNRTLFSSTTSGAVHKHTYMLSVLTSGLSTLDYKNTWNDTQYVVPRTLSIEDCDLLYHFKQTWPTIDLFSNTGLALLSSGEVDYSWYNNFITSWGNNLYRIFNLLDIDG